MLDFVYIVKKSEINEDLRYSLRSIAKFYPENKVWIVGYKPSWVKNVEYLPVEQTGDKWKNSITNILAACNCKDISEDFILMNDDFFMIKPLVPIEVVGNANLGTLDKSLLKWKGKTGSWIKAFAQIKDLLQKIGVKGPYYDYETHLPLEINKEKFIEVMNLPEVQEFMKTSKVLHKRTLYKNYNRNKTSITLPADSKIHQTYDDSISRVNVCGWLSVYDGQIGNMKFSNINRMLVSFPTSIYELDIPKESIKRKNIVINEPYKILTSFIDRPSFRKDFIHF